MRTITDIFEDITAEAVLREWTVSHEDVVDMIQLVGVDLREVFDENGTIITFEAKQQRIQQQVIERLIGLGVEIPDDAHGRLLEEGQSGAFTCPECGA